MRVSPSRWLAWPEATTTGSTRLFCFPCAGAGASFYRSLAAELPPEIQLCAVQLPGRQNRIEEAAFSDMSALAEAVADVLAPHLEVPFGLLGYSMGGFVAFEVARELRRRGRPSPRRLFVAAAASPGTPSAASDPRRSGPVALRDRIAAMAEPSDPEAPEQEELVALLTPTLRADIELCARYRPAPEPLLDCPLTVVGGTDDDEVSIPDLYAWRAWTRGAVAVTLLSGDHFFIHRQGGALAGLVGEAFRGGATP